MPIEFIPLETTAIDDTAAAVYRMQVQAVDTGMGSTAGIDTLVAQLLVAASGEDEGGGEAAIVVPDSAFPDYMATAFISDASHSADAVSAGYAVAGVGYDAQPGEDVAEPSYIMTMFAAESPPPPTAYGFLVEQPAVIMGYGGMVFDNVSEDLELAGLHSNLPLYGIRERMRVAAARDDTFEGLARALDTLELGDALAVILRELLTEGFELEADTSYQYTAMARVVDALRLSGLVGSQLEAVNALVAAVAMRSLLDLWLTERVADGLELADTLSNALRAAAQLVEKVLLDGDVSGSGVRLGVVVDEKLELDAAPGTVLEAIAAIREGMSFVLHMNVDDGKYVAYSINTESKAVTQYQNYPFNSFAWVGGRCYGMSPDGIRELEGTTDDGAPIAARFRLAMTNLGTGRMKRMQAAYLGYTSTGELRLKTITTAPDRVKEAHYYRLLPQPSDSPSEARVKIGQGLRSVYWGFELEAIDGAAFAIDLLALNPIVIEQWLQGQNAGK